MDADAARRVQRWMYLWIAVGVVIVLVVIGFLFAIANELESIDAGLDSTRQEVEGAEGDVRPLPDHIQDVNVALARIDEELEPLPGQADTVVSNLRSIRTTLTSVEGSLNGTHSTLDTTRARLVETAGTLQRIATSLDVTAGLLVDTEAVLTAASGDLGRILGVAREIEQELELAQNFSSLGTAGIWRRVRFLNGGRLLRDRPRNRHGLHAIEADTDDIVASVDEVNKHLESTCTAIPEQLGELLGPGAPLPPVTKQRGGSPAAEPATHRDEGDPDDEEPREPPPPDDGPPC